jgi:nucleotide-binding universal stress UspA family protein
MKIILAVDDSAYSKEVVSSVSERDWPLDTQFKILTVLEPLDCLGEKYEDMIHGVDAKRKKAIEHLCQATREKLVATIPGAIIHYEIRAGNPKNEIIDAAAEWSADRIIVGAHGQRGCPHNLLGSVSRTVAGCAPCTVEIVREKNTKATSKSHKETTETVNI